MLHLPGFVDVPISFRLQATTHTVHRLHHQVILGSADNYRLLFNLLLKTA